MITTSQKSKTVGFSNIFANIRQSMDDYRLYRKTVRELSSLSDRELNDLSISRWDIERIAREAVAAS